MGQYRRHVFVKYLRGEAVKAESHIVGGKPVDGLRDQPGVKGPNKTKDAK